MSEWISTSIEYGQFKLTNGDIDVTVLPDFSGQITNAAGEFIEFKNLEDVIKIGELLKGALFNYYGAFDE